VTVYNWPSIRARYIAGEKPYAISKSLNGRPGASAIGKRRDKEGWDNYRKNGDIKVPPTASQAKTMGRQETVLDALRKGATITLAAAIAGVARDTVHRWRKADSQYDTDCRQAMGEFGQEHLGYIVQASQNGDSSMSKFLVERHPSTKEDYGQQINTASGLTLNFGIIRDAAQLKDITPKPRMIEQD